jgi:hypothetical protein
MQFFDRLTSEKMTPYFLNLAKKGTKTESTLLIRSDTGVEFADPEHNHAYIYRNSMRDCIKSLRNIKM